MVGLLSWFVVLASLLAPLSPVQAADLRLDDPGTYLIEVTTGRVLRLGAGALVAWSPDSTSVAVADLSAESPTPRLRLFTVPDGTSREVKIADQGEIAQLRWSPNGEQLVFTLTRVGMDPGPALMTVNPRTATVRQIVRGNVGELTWTPDGSGITAVTLDDAGGSIVTFDAQSGEIRETFGDVKDANCQRGLAWSPDGAYLAFGGPGLHEGCGDVGNWGVWTWQPATRKLRQLFQGAADAPVWLASGEVVALVSEPESESIPPLSLVRLAPDGGPLRPLAKDIPRMFPQPPRLIQVVGNAVLFPVSTCDRGEAHIWSPGRATSMRLTPEDVYAYRPALAPDGRELAYVRVSDAPELIVAPTGPGDARVIATTTHGLQVGTVGPWEVGGDWSPDGKWIAVEVTTEQFRDCIP